MTPGKGILSILLLSVSTLLGQTIKFDRVTTRNGLLSDEVYNLYQDRSGYLWIFSPFGTVKSDGSVFKPVLKNLPLKESFIFSICENEKGEKWVANSNARIFEIRNDSAILIQGLEKVTDELKKQGSEIFQLQVNKDGGIYIITKGYSYKLTKTGSSYHITNLSLSLAEDSVMYRVDDFKGVTAVYVNRKMVDGIRYINKMETRTYIEIYDGNKVRSILNPFYKINVLNSAAHLRNLKKYEDNFYFLYSNAFATINADNELSYTKLKFPALNFIRDNDGHFWVGCLNDGLYELNEKGMILNHYLSNTTVNDLLIDHQNGLWVSTPDLGLYHCSDLKNKCFGPDAALGSSISFLKF